MNSKNEIENIKKIDNPKILDDLIVNYNWDNGFAIPMQILNNKNIDFVSIIRLFWLSEAIEWVGIEKEPEKWQEPHYVFSKAVIDKIERYENPKKDTIFKPSFTKMRYNQKVWMI